MFSMVQRDPHTSYEDEHPGFEYLLQHNASAPFDAGYHDAARGADIHPPSLGHASPQLPHVAVPGTPQTLNSPFYSDLRNTFSPSFENSFNGFGQNHDQYYQGQAKHHAQETISPKNSIGKMATTASSNGHRVRSGRSAARSHSPYTRTEGSGTRASKPSKSKKASKTSAKTPQLDGPLSELTRDMNIPVRDMEEWVNRPVEVRLKEVEKRNGYVTRPMNSFMLYRSAYAERTKQYCIQNNHQVVSAVSGQSWPREPDSVRDFYNALAHIERDNHAKAHPTYKFSPTKAITSSNSHRKGFTSEPESEADDSEAEKDPDGEWKPPSGRGTKTGQDSSRSRRKQQQDTVLLPSDASHQYTPNSSLSPQQPMSMSVPVNQAQQLQWQQQNYSSQMPVDYGWQVMHDNQAMLDAQYQHQYELQLRRYGQQQRQQFAPSPYYQQQLPSLNPYEQQSLMVGLPAGEEYGSMHYQLSMGGGYDADFQVDPILLQFEHQQTPPMDDPATPRDAHLGEELSPLDGSDSFGFKPDPLVVARHVSVADAVTPTRGLFDNAHEELLFQNFGQPTSEFESLMDARHPPNTPTSS